MGSTKQFEMVYKGEQFILEIHTENPAHEARIRWKATNRGLSGEWGRLYLPESMPKGTDQIIQDPVLVFGADESITIKGEERPSIEVPRPLATELQNLIDEFGTATVDSTSITTNPAHFPLDIDYRTKIATEHLDKAWWNSHRYIMWYSPDKPPAQNVPDRLAELVSQLDVYGYQIKHGNLVHRTNETPSDEAVEELKQLLNRTSPEADTRLGSGSYRIEHRLE